MILALLFISGSLLGVCLVLIYALMKTEAKYDELLQKTVLFIDEIEKANKMQIEKTLDDLVSTERPL